MLSFPQPKFSLFTFTTYTHVIHHFVLVDIIFHFLGLFCLTEYKEGYVNKLGSDLGSNSNSELTTHLTCLSPRFLLCLRSKLGITAICVKLYKARRMGDFFKKNNILIIYLVVLLPRFGSIYVLSNLNIITIKIYVLSNAH